jgi:dCTP deaminase
VILTGKAIKHCVQNGSIEVEPFNEDQIGPNSYDMRLSNKVAELKLMEVSSNFLDIAESIPTHEYEFDSSGIVLQPNRLYLMSTVERTFSDKYVPCIEGRSSIGRLGINVHATAGFGDLGFNGKWTLEVSTIYPIRIYAGMRICQVFFHSVLNPVSESEVPLKLYSGKYQQQNEPVASKIYLEHQEWNR